MGTNTNAHGLVVMVKPDPEEIAFGKFEKALWVSRLGPNATEGNVRCIWAHFVITLKQGGNH